MSVWMLIFPSFFGSRVNAAPLPEIRVGFYEQPPKIFINDEGKEDGFWPDIVKYIANQEGWNVVWVPGVWQECLDRVANGSIDVMVDVSYREDRAIWYNFTNEVVFQNWGVIYAADGVRIDTLLDLEDKNVSVQAGNTHTIYIDNLLDQLNINCTFIPVSDSSIVFEYLDNKSADAGVVNRLFGMTSEKNYKVHKTSLVFNPSDLKFAVHNGSKNANVNTAYLIQKLDEYIITLKADPNSIYYQSIEKHFMGIEGSTVYELPEWFIPALISIIAIVFVLAIASFVLRQRKQALERTNSELNSTLLELALLVEKIPDGVLVTEPGGKIRLANNAFKRIFEETVGLKLGLEENIFDYSNRSDFLNRIHTIVQNNDPASPTVEIQKDHWIQVVPSFLRLNKSEPPILVIIETRDVTHFVEYDNLRKRFVSMVSHELRTPITAIHMSLENLARYRAKMTEEQQQAMITSMTESVQVLRKMIEDLLVLSRVDSKKIDLKLEQVALIQVVETVAMQVDAYLKAKSMTLEMDIPTEMSINADKTRLSQVLRILLDNAIKFSPEKSKIGVSAKGGITRQINGVPVTGTLIQVRDSGIGIKESDLKNLFERFFRADNARDIQGTGLGLSIAKELVVLHNGEIFVESTIGNGSTFSVFLPSSAKPLVLP